MVSRLLARSRQSCSLGRSRHYDHRWFRAHDNCCRFHTGQLLSDMFDLLKLCRELRADLFDVHSELRSDMQHVLDLRHARNGERSRVAACV
jgi:hypothetical protein